MAPRERQAAVRRERDGVYPAGMPLERAQMPSSAAAQGAFRWPPPAAHPVLGGGAQVGRAAVILSDTAAPRRKAGTPRGPQRHTRVRR